MAKRAGVPFIAVPLPLLMPDKTGHPRPNRLILTWSWIQHCINGENPAPSINSIASKSGLSSRSVQRAIGELEGLGVLKRDRRVKLDGQATNAYSLLYDGFSQSFHGVTTVAPPDNGVTPSNCNLDLVLSTSVNKKVITKKDNITKKKDNNILLLDTFVSAYNSNFASVKKSHYVRRVSSGTPRHKRIMKVISEEPEMGLWVERFIKATTIDPLIRPKNGYKGATIDSFTYRSFLDKLDNGEYDNWTNTVDVSNTWAEKERRAKVFNDACTSVQGFLEDSYYKDNAVNREHWGTECARIKSYLTKERAPELYEEVMKYAKQCWQLLRRGE